MSTQKYSAVQTYKAVQLMLSVTARNLESAPLSVFPNAMQLTSGVATDPNFLDSWNQQLLRIPRLRRDLKNSSEFIEGLDMSADEGFRVLIGFLNEYKSTLMFGTKMQHFMATLRTEQKLRINIRPIDGYWNQWLMCLKHVAAECPGQSTQIDTQFQVPRTLRNIAPPAIRHTSLTDQPSFGWFLRALSF